ncbi:MAG: ABC transporter permease [Planctomycetia bacterium]|nr:ABC transporter permease [Planctomycetia bacterium]
MAEATRDNPASTITPAGPSLGSVYGSAAQSPLTVRPWLAAGSLAWRELVRFLRQRNRVFGALGQPIIFWLLFSAGFSGMQGLGYQHFFPGTLVMILLFTAIFATISIIEDRREGFLQSVLVAPLPRWSMVAGKIFGGASLAMLQGLLFLILGLLTVKGMSPGFFGVIGVVLLMAVVSLALCGLGFLLAWRMESTQGFHAIMMVLLMPMWLLSGAFFPAAAGWMGWVVALNPLTYGVSGIRQMLGLVDAKTAAAEPSLWLCWLVSLLFAGAMFALSSASARRATRGDLL